MHVLRLLVFILVLAGFATVSTGCDVLDKIKPPTGPTPSGPPAANAAIRYTAIGASDANGVGASVACIPFTECENGTGNVPLLARRLRAASHEVTLTNLGIPEAVLSPAIQTIARANGRDVFANFVEREMPFVPANATLVTIFGGPNDTLALVDAIEKGAAGTNVRAYIDTQIAAFGADYDRLVKGTQERAPSAFLVILNMPNLAGLPFAVNAGQPRRQLLQAVSVGFSREANRRAGTGVVVADLMCDPQIYDRTRYSSDGFHPNDAGYAYLADSKLLPVVNGASSSPATSCSQMTMVPAL
ncbi:MAG: GDSL-type esterase/lipase family protein [Vicinamibacterales bacterium]|nr:GDSL-type esterase/lipase family protein [Vicinamibacterales bacterium]